MAKRKAPAEPLPETPSRKQIAQDIKDNWSDMPSLSGNGHPFVSCHIFNTVMKARYHTTDSVPNDVLTATAIPIMVGDFQPKDVGEAMLAAQMVAMHEAAMECARLAAVPGQTFEARDMNLRHAAKLSRTYAALLETLDRRRGRGVPQVVRVERVNVEPGAQAVVGVVTHPGGQGAGGGVGCSSKSEERAHVQAAAVAIADAREPPLRSADEGREPMPCPDREGPQPVPEARWRRG